MSDEASRPTYGNWRRPRTAGLGPLSLGGTIVLAVGLVMAVIALPFSLPLGFILFGVLVVVVLPMAVKDRWGRTGYERLGQRVEWRLHRRRRAHLYVAGPLSRTPSVACGLPGLAARMEAFDAFDAIGRPFVVVHHPRTGHVSAVIDCAPPGTALIDDVDVDQAVAAWGAWLADLGHEPGVVAAAVVVETAPDSGVQLRQAVEGRMVDDAAPFATATLREVVRTFPAGAASTTMRITVTWARSRAGSRRRSVEDLAVEIGARLPELCSSLATTGAGMARPLDRAQLAAALRAAFDPSIRAAIDDTPGEVDWDECGPVQAEERRGEYLHDGATSVSWVMGQAPAGVVRSNVLHRLLVPDSEVALKRVALLYRPYGPGRSASIVENDIKVTRFQAGQRKIGRARDGVEMRAAERTAEEEARGAGLVRFGMVVTATVWGADEQEELQRAGSVVEQLGATARIRLRRAWRSQATTFLAGLPLGLVLPAHLRVPRDWHDA